MSEVRSSFVRRLLRAHDDPAKQRVLAWLQQIDDASLLKFGLSPCDIAILRETASAIGARDRIHRQRCSVTVKDR